MSDFEEQSSEDYEVFRKNHFGIRITNPVDNKVYDDLRLCAHSIDVNLYSGKLILRVYATKNILEIISKFIPLQKLNLRFIMYSADGENKFVVYDDFVYVEDIIFNSKYDIDKNKENYCAIVTIMLTSRAT